MLLYSRSDWEANFYTVEQKDTKMRLEENTLTFLKTLWRGGGYAYYWENPGKKSIWFEANLPPTQVEEKNKNIYFSIHPCIKTKDLYERAMTQDIANITCLYADFDSKFFGDRMLNVLNHILSLDPLPSVIVNSGGGYHAYWFLNNVIEITNENREKIKMAQNHWVTHVKGDESAKDITRSLRVPGTKNIKYTPERSVFFVLFEKDYLYDFQALVQTLPPMEEKIIMPISVDINSQDRIGLYIQRALYYETQNIISAFEGFRNNQINRSSFSLGTLLGSSWAAPYISEHKLVEILLNASVQAGISQSEAARTIQSGIKAGMNKPRNLATVSFSKRLADETVPGWQIPSRSPTE